MGSFLRRTLFGCRLPQFLNVLLRRHERGWLRAPERPSLFIEDFKRQIPKYHLRHKMKAGITGWAQDPTACAAKPQSPPASNTTSTTSSTGHCYLDLKILLRTMLGGFISRNAYFEDSL